MWNWIKKYPDYCFLGILLIMGIITGLFKNINMAPASIHQGAQADRASIAWNYAFTNSNFFEPRVMEIRQSEGVTGMEFPIIPYVVSIFYRIFGFSEIYYRSLILLFSLWGLFMSYKITHFFVFKLLHRYLLIILFSTTPLLYYYFNNYLPDPVALAISFGGWYYFFKWNYGLSRRRSFFYMILLFTLAGLIKVSFMMNWAVVFGLLVLNIRNKNSYLPYLNRIGDLLWLLVSPLLVLLWYSYASFLTRETGNYHFLQSIQPAPSFKDSMELLNSTINNWSSNFSISYLFMGLIILFLVRLRKDSPYPILRYILLLMILGNIIYYFLFQKQFLHHDYYLIALYPLLYFLILFNYTNYLGNGNTFTGILPVLTLVFLFVLPFYSITNTIHYLKERYRTSSYWYQPVLSPYEEYNKLASRINKIIPQSENIVVAFDVSPNTMLYYAKRPGLRIAPDFNQSLVKEIIAYGKYQWLVCNDVQTFRRLYPQIKITEFKSFPNYTFCNIR